VAADPRPCVEDVLDGVPARCIEGPVCQRGPGGGHVVPRRPDGRVGVGGGELAALDAGADVEDDAVSGTLSGLDEADRLSVAARPCRITMRLRRGC
jgi:hypothetical protein